MMVSRANSNGAIRRARPGGGEALPRADLPSPYHLPVWAYPPILPTP